ncbi:MAG: hypothetical protein ACKO2H_07350, partial [Bacteroidota bacterium]
MGKHVTNLSYTFLFMMFAWTISIVCVQELYAQDKPRTFIIAGVSVEGNTYSDAQTIITISGLK